MKTLISWRNVTLEINPSISTCCTIVNCSTARHRMRKCKKFRLRQQSECLGIQKRFKTTRQPDKRKFTKRLKTGALFEWPFTYYQEFGQCAVCCCEENLNYWCAHFHHIICLTPTNCIAINSGISIHFFNLLWMSAMASFSQHRFCITAHSFW